MKYLSILTLMTAFAAFSTGASAQENVMNGAPSAPDAPKLSIVVSAGCEAPACQAALAGVKQQCKIIADIQAGKATVTSTCNPEQLGTMMEDSAVKTACADCKITATVE